MDDPLVSMESRRVELTKEEEAKVEEKKKLLDLSDPNAVTRFGLDIQRKVSDFTDNVLSDVKSRDTGHAGKALTELMLHLKELNVDGLSGSGLFSKLPFVGPIMDTARKFMARYQSVSTQMVKVVEELERVREQLLKDVDRLEGFYNANNEYFKELHLYIVAGEERLAEFTTIEIPKLEAEAKSSGDQIAFQKYKDMVHLAGRLEKKVHDLRLTRMVALQAGPQIRLVQNNNHVLAEKIQTSILNTIPLWKNQMIMAISLLRQRQALEFQKEVSETTRKLLEKNAEMLKESSIEAAREAERGVVDMDTLKKVNADLISTIDETVRLQRDGMIKREQAAAELERLEREIKEKLIAVREASES